jgi:hypothetical protein
MRLIGNLVSGGEVVKRVWEFEEEGWVWRGRERKVVVNGEKVWWKDGCWVVRRVK